ncbi:MAG TPA: hemerythrin domain-containing protein [Enhygromyxa sp.]|nr:hemerythrin domain-containing protein [Enhygromyxa sp.]
MTTIDIYTNVHKGIRRALFEACVALGRAGDDPQRSAAARALLGEVLHFVTHHGENEDLLLVPLLDARAPAVAGRMRSEHARIEPKLAALIASRETAPIGELYHRACEFVAIYLEHMREEEEQLEPAIREALTPDELAGFGRGSIERTAPADQRMMLGWMLPAMTRADAVGFLARLPGPLADQLRPLTAA